MFAGSVWVGGVGVSRTVTVKLPLAVLLWASVAEQFTVVVPRATCSPRVGEQLTATAPSTRSLADAEYETAAPRRACRRGGDVQAASGWAASSPAR